jgi:hypothetical protein
MYCGCDLSFDFAPYFWGYLEEVRLAGNLVFASLLHFCLLRSGQSYIRPGGNLTSGQEGSWPGGRPFGPIEVEVRRRVPPGPLLLYPDHLLLLLLLHSTYSYADGLQSPCCGLPRRAVVWGQQTGQHRLWITTMGELCIMIEI